MNEKYRILYAEDEQALREITFELLTEEGFDCVAVSDGVAAVEKLKSEKFDLIISDFRMPHMDGALLLFWCRQNDIHCPFIFLSGNLERLPIEKAALKDCCAAYLHKPIGINELLKAIESARTRSHEFDCHGESFSRKENEAIMEGIEFNGQHFLKR